MLKYFNQHQCSSYMGNGFSKMVAFSLMLVFLLPMLNHNAMNNPFEQFSAEKEIAESEENNPELLNISYYNMNAVNTDINGENIASSSKSTSDGGAIIMSSIIVNDSPSDSDIWIIKTDSNGAEEWNNTFGGPFIDLGHDIIQNSEGGYTITGRYSYSSFNDLWILKIDNLGNEIWSKTFGGDDSDWGVSIVETSDGEYISVGNSFVDYQNGGNQILAIKVDSEGSLVWEKEYGGAHADYSQTISKTSDGEFILAGNTYSFGDPAEGHAWLVKIDSDGNEIWNNTYSEIHHVISRIVETQDGDYVGVGTGWDGQHEFMWMFKADSMGNFVWSSNYDNNSIGNSVSINAQGDFFFTGRTILDDNIDLVIVKTDKSGIQEWNLTKGGTGDDYPVDIIEICDSTFSLVGVTSSFGTEVSSPWFLKLRIPGTGFSSACNEGGDAWLNLELISWQGNSSTTWDTDGTDMDVQFQVCIDLDGDSDGISPLCTWTEIWNNTLTLSNTWETTFDLIEDNTTLNITIECWDNDDFADEWGNGPDACDMNPDDDEWRLFYEVNWSNITTETFSGDGSIGNDTQWGNAESTWKVTVSYYGDEDNDGVSDYVDICSNSQDSEEIDEVGCSWQQYDWDSDGILNVEDPCPTMQEDYCGTEGDYVEISRFTSVHGGTTSSAVVYFDNRNARDSYSISPDGRFLSLLKGHGGCQGCQLKGYTGAYLFSLDDVDEYVSLNNGQQGILAFGFNAGETAHMTFSKDSEQFFVSSPGGFGAYNSSSPEDETRNPDNPGEHYYYANSNIPAADHASPSIHEEESSGANWEHVQTVSISQNDRFLYTGGLVYDFQSGNVDCCGTSNFSYGQIYSPNGNHHDSIVNLKTTYLRPDGLSIRASSGIAEIYYAQEPSTVIQTINLPHDAVQVGSTSDGNSVVILSANETVSSIQNFDLLTGLSREIIPFTADGGVAKGLHVSKNGLRIVAVYDGSVKIFERDRDSDGFTDTEDLCPEIAGGFSGCLEEYFDTDEDGVNDKDDQCPGTTKGTNVDATGCAMNQLDSDGDGISDATDQCPNTPNGDSVGLTGCSGSQVDSDGDGIYDSQDNCPNTPSGTTVDSTGCAPDDVVDLDSDGDGVRDSVDACPNSATGIVVDSTGCETSGDVQEVEDEVSTDDSSDALYGFIGLLVVVGIIAAAVAGIKSLFSSSDDGYDWDYDSYSSVSNQTISTPQPEPNLELQNIVAELERQRMQSEREMNQLRQQQAQQSSASEIAAMQREMQALQQRVADSEQAKLQLQNEIEQVKIQKDESINMQDSVVGGDMVASGGQKIESQTNVTGTDPEAIARIIFEAQEKERERMRKERNE